jgi:hypothetical protein
MKVQEIEVEKKRMNRSRIVSPQEWETARQQLLVKEKELTRARDALAPSVGGCRGWPWKKDYEFDGPKGKASLLDLFDGRRQLIVYRAFFEPGVKAGPSMPASAAPWWPTRSLTRSSERPRYYTRVRLSRAADGYRAPKGTNGLAVHSLVHDHGRLRQGLRRG